MAKKGFPKTGGRKAGTPNKETRFLGEILNAKNFSIVDRLVELLPTLDPGKRADVLMDLLAYLYPRRAPTQSYSAPGEKIFDPALEVESRPVAKAVSADERKQLIQSARAAITLAESKGTYSKTELDQSKAVLRQFERKI